MKKLIFSVIATFAMAMTLTGCLGDDTVASQYHKLTNSEKTAIMSLVTGNYKGDVMWYNYNYSLDSLSATWTVKSDTTITLQYPVAFLANFLDSTLIDAKTALASAPSETINFTASLPPYIYNETWTSVWQEQGQYELPMYPNEDKHSFSVGDHKFVLTFCKNTMTFGSSYFTPFLIYKSDQTQGYLLLTSLLADDKTISLNCPTIFYGKRY